MSHRRYERGLAPDPGVQRAWGLAHAIWFSLMGIGGGLFIVAHLIGIEDQLGSWFGVPLVDVISFLMIGAGGVVLVKHLGRPGRVLTVLMNPRSSWISRGAIADLVFLLSGTALMLPGVNVGGRAPFSWLPWAPAGNAPVARGIAFVALISAGLVIYYAGHVLAVCRSIPYWQSPTVPLQFVSSSLASSVGVLMLLETRAGMAVGTFEVGALGACCLAQAGVCSAHLFRKRLDPASARSLRLLIRGSYRTAFAIGVLGCGLLLPVVLVAAALYDERLRAALGPVSLVLTVPAGLALRLLMLRVGVYAMTYVTVPIRGRP